jgi:hypothetical protein
VAECSMVLHAQAEKSTDLSLFVWFSLRNAEDTLQVLGDFFQYSPVVRVTSSGLNFLFFFKKKLYVFLNTSLT